MVTKTRLKKYAELIARCGVNVQKGQDVVIQAELDQPEFVHMVVDACYKVGARRVSVDWSYQPLTRSHVRFCKDKVLGSLEPWQVKKLEDMADTLPARIYLVSSDPDGLAGINQRKYAMAMRERSKITKPIRDRMENKYQWCIAAVPGKKWAKKVFPGVRESVAEKRMWESILTISRVDDDPIAAWQRHNESMAEKCDILNSLGARELIYTSEGSGTDFRVGLIPEALFCAGGEYTQGSHVFFNPNIPTEEVFTSPMRGKAEGIVYSSLPLSHAGQLIDRFWLRFHEGKVVACGAEQGEDVLREMIGMDEGAAYLGECALVPYSSPIRASGLLFYNTLFDENAACHLAIGRGFTNLLRGYESMTEEEAHAKGINDSMTHVDFMIGTADLTIRAVCEDGRELVIFENGEWAI